MGCRGFETLSPSNKEEERLDLWLHRQRRVIWLTASEEKAFGEGTKRTDWIDTGRVEEEDKNRKNERGVWGKDRSLVRRQESTIGLYFKWVLNLSCKSRPMLPGRFVFVDVLQNYLHITVQIAGNMYLNDKMLKNKNSISTISYSHRYIKNTKLYI